MLAIAAAIVFAFALLADLGDVDTTDLINYPTLTTIGLFLLALHMAGVGAGFDWRSRRSYGRPRARSRR